MASLQTFRLYLARPCISPSLPVLCNVSPNGCIPERSFFHQPIFPSAPPPRSLAHGSVPIFLLYFRPFSVSPKNNFPHPFGRTSAGDMTSPPPLETLVGSFPKSNTLRRCQGSRFSGGPCNPADKLFFRMPPGTNYSSQHLVLGCLQGLCIFLPQCPRLCAP